MVLMINAHGLTTTDPARDTITTTAFMQTSDNSYAVTEDKQEEGILPQNISGTYIAKPCGNRIGTVSRIIGITVTFASLGETAQSAFLAEI